VFYIIFSHSYIRLFFWRLNWILLGCLGIVFFWVRLVKTSVTLSTIVLEPNPHPLQLVWFFTFGLFYNLTLMRLASIIKFKNLTESERIAWRNLVFQKFCERWFYTFVTKLMFTHWEVLRFSVKMLFKLNYISGQVIRRQLAAFGIQNYCVLQCITITPTWETCRTIYKKLKCYKKNSLLHY